MILLDGRDLALRALSWATRAVPDVARAAISTQNPALARSRFAAEQERQHAGRQARATTCVRHAREHGLRDSNDAASSLARFYFGERVEVFVALARCKQGAVKMIYWPGTRDEVCFDADRLCEWIEEVDARAVWLSHQHIATRAEAAEWDVDQPSATDERLARSLEDVRVVQDQLIIDASSCGPSEPEVRFWSFNEWRHCSAYRDALDPETSALARAARSRRRRR